MSLRRGRRRRLWVGVASGLFGLAWAGWLLGPALATSWLFVEGGPVRADAIVVLGGDWGERSSKAASLFRGGAARFVLVSGDGDCEFIRDRLVAGGVPAAAIQLECASGSTRENAAFSSRVLKERGITSAIIVTSWYHSRRALACFRHYGKGMVLSSYPGYEGTLRRKPAGDEVRLVWREYAALGWYWVRYGIMPVGDFVRTPEVGGDRLP